MINILKKVVEDALARLHYQVTTYLPSLLAAVTLILGAYVTAVLARWFIHKIFKGLAVDKFLRESGVVYLLAPSGRIHASRLAAQTVYWLILLCGFLLGLNVFGTDLTTQIAQGIMRLLPKLFVAGLILLGGSWLGQYLGRSAVVWAVNENLPRPHRVSALVRTLVVFAAVVVAADQLDFAKSVFLSAFIIFVGGAVLAVSLAIGLGKRGVGRLLDEKDDHADDSAERSLWSHL
jgi:hypothetical protein